MAAKRKERRFGLTLKPIYSYAITDNLDPHIPHRIGCHTQAGAGLFAEGRPALFATPCVRTQEDVFENYRVVTA
jgi:hypothetical protein